MTSEDNDGKKLTPTEMAIIEMMKKQNLQAQIVRQQGSDTTSESTKQTHAFWDTQVSYSSKDPTTSLSLMRDYKSLFLLHFSTVANASRRTR